MTSARFDGWAAYWLPSVRTCASAAGLALRAALPYPALLRNLARWTPLETPCPAPFCSETLPHWTPLERRCPAPLAWCRDIVGFRAPFLETDENVRKVLSDNGFLYERCAGASMAWPAKSTV